MLVFKRAVFLAALACPLSACFGAINLQLVPSVTQATVGQQVFVDLMAQTTSGAAENILSFQMIFGWETGYLHLDGFSNPSAVSYTGLGFLRDAYGINNTPTITTPPTDGDAILIGLGPFGSSITVPSGGLRLARLSFTALLGTNATPISVLPSAGSPTGTTVVYGAGGPNIDVTGSLSGTSVRIVPGPSTLGGLIGGALVCARRRRRAGTAA